MPFKSKNDIVEDVISALKEIEGAGIEYSLNSKRLRVLLKVDDVSIQIEVKVAKEVPVQIVSNKELAKRFNTSCTRKAIPYQFSTRMDLVKETCMHNDAAPSETLKKLSEAFAFAEELRRKGRLDEIEGFLSQLMEALPDSAELRFMLGEVRVDQNRVAEAVRFFKEAVQLNPCFSAAYNNLARILQPSGAAMSGKLSHA